MEPARANRRQTTCELKNLAGLPITTGMGVTGLCRPTFSPPTTCIRVKAVNVVQTPPSLQLIYTPLLINHDPSFSPVASIPSEVQHLTASLSRPRHLAAANQPLNTRHHGTTHHHSGLPQHGPRLLCPPPPPPGRDSHIQQLHNLPRRQGRQPSRRLR